MIKKSFYYIMVESEISKNTQWDIIFRFFTSEDIDHVIISRQKCVFKMATFVWRAANQFLSLFNEKQHVSYQENENTTRKHWNDAQVFFEFA